MCIRDSSTQAIKEENSQKEGEELYYLEHTLNIKRGRININYGEAKNNSERHSVRLPKAKGEITATTTAQYDTTRARKGGKSTRRKSLR